MNKYFDGTHLYGNDFGAEEIEAWYAAEEEGYANIDAADADNYRYIYHGINRFGAFDHINVPEGASVLSIGGAYGYELEPIIDKIDEITILEPSQQLRKAMLSDIPIVYVTPVPSGKIPIADNRFDIITCFGTLHHIPNVSFVIKEVARVLKPGGMFIVREPIVSMGDWRKPRRGLTANERGIPLPLMKRFIGDAGLDLFRAQPCMVRPLALLFSKLLRTNPMNSRSYLQLDVFLANILLPISCYHATNIIQKIRPAWSYFLATKPIL